MDQPIFTVGELRAQLEHLEDDHELQFGGGLTFYRIKQRGDALQMVEFNEAQGYLSPGFKKRNPNVMVTFIDTRATEWDEAGVVGSVDVEVR